MPRDRRALLVGGVVVAVALLGIRLLPWSARRLAVTRERVAAKSREVADAETLVRAVPSLRDSLGRTLARMVALAPALLDGRTSAEAAASLTAQLNGLAARAAMRVARIEAMSDSAGAGDVRPVRVRAQLEGDVRGLTAFLAAVEGGAPLLSVEALAIAAPDPGQRPGAAELLHIEVEVTGWHLASAGEPR